MEIRRMKYFNTEGCCNPEEHYMVNLDDRLKYIKKFLVDRKKYFVINRGRQYGKTTTLAALEKYLKNDYIVLSLDFQQIGTADFANETTFAAAFSKKLLMECENIEEGDSGILRKLLSDFRSNHLKAGLNDLFECLSDICKSSSRPIVLMIDEADSASNNQVFIDFLAQLRGYYLARERRPIFQSVIFAGVYDIKNLKLKLRPDEEHKYNSPWNIAAKFNIDMSFSVEQIASMLKEYEDDHHIGMYIQTIAGEIYQYTSGYPYLVSDICKLLDEELPGNSWLESPVDIWSAEGVVEAVKLILVEQAPFFESMVRQLEEYPEMKKLLKAVLFQGKRVSYNPDLPSVSLASMFGYIINVKGAYR